MIIPPPAIRGLYFLYLINAVGARMSRETVHVSKRVLIRGEGTLGETRIDHRANCPALRVSRTCLIRDLDVDMTGFREAVKIEGPVHTQPAFLNCIIRWDLSSTGAFLIRCHSDVFGTVEG